MAGVTIYKALSQQYGNCLILLIFVHTLACQFAIQIWAMQNRLTQYTENCLLKELSKFKVACQRLIVEESCVMNMSISMADSFRCNSIQLHFGLLEEPFISDLYLLGISVVVNQQKLFLFMYFSYILFCYLKQSGRSLSFGEEKRRMPN